MALEHRQQHDRIVGGLGSGVGAGRGHRQRTMQQAQGTFAMITAGGAKLVENAPLVRPTGAW